MRKIGKYLGRKVNLITRLAEQAVYVRICPVPVTTYL